MTYKLRAGLVLALLAISFMSGPAWSDKKSATGPKHTGGGTVGASCVSSFNRCAANCNRVYPIGLDKDSYGLDSHARCLGRCDNKYHCQVQ